jgi:hypothetical protein
VSCQPDIGLWNQSGFHRQTILSVLIALSALRSVSRSESSAAAPLDFIGIERTGVSAGDPSLNVSSQLLELHVVEMFFSLPSGALPLLGFMSYVKGGAINEVMPL